mgnify:CR=1 FL=1
MGQALVAEPSSDSEPNNPWLTKGFELLRSAAKGYAKKATPQKLFGEIANTLITLHKAQGGVKEVDIEFVKQAEAGLQKAITSKTEDLTNYYLKKMEAVLARFSE